MLELLVTCWELLKIIPLLLQPMPDYDKINKKATHDKYVELGLIIECKCVICEVTYELKQLNEGPFAIKDKVQIK